MGDGQIRLETKPVGETSAAFFVRSCQRGYRWGKAGVAEAGLSGRRHAGAKSGRHAAHDDAVPFERLGRGRISPRGKQPHADTTGGIAPVRSLPHHAATPKGVATDRAPRSVQPLRLGTHEAHAVPDLSVGEDRRARALMVGASTSQRKPPQGISKWQDSEGQAAFPPCLAQSSP